MPDDPIVDLLAKQSTARLRDMLNYATKQIDDLLVQRAWIERALADKGAPAMRATPSTSAQAQPKHRRSSKRDAIIAAMRTQPKRVWLPSEVRDALAEDGIAMTVEAVRVALRRIGDGGNLVRPHNGNGWMLPTAGIPARPEFNFDQVAPSFGANATDGQDDS